MSSRVISSLIIIGLMFADPNIWFLIWLLSIGLVPISMVTEINFADLVVLFLGFIWLDYL